MSRLAVRLRYRIDQARMRWRVSFGGGSPPGLLAAPRQRRKTRRDIADMPVSRLAEWRRRRELARDIAGTAGLILAVGGFFLLIVIICVAAFLLNS